MIDAVNRVLLATVGLVLVAAGAAMAAVATGALPLAQPAELGRQARRTIDADPLIWWSVIIAGALILTVLGALWSLRQLVAHRGGGGLSNIVLDRSDRGHTTIEAAKVAQVAAADLQRSQLITAGSARLVEADDGRQLRTRIDVPIDADLTSVHDVARDVYERVAGLLGEGRFTTQTVIRPLARPARRVE